MTSLHHLIRYRAVEARVLGVAAVLWLLVRLAAALAALYANGSIPVGRPVDVSIRTSVIVVLAVTALSQVDVRRQNVDLLLANLGTSRTTTVLIPLVAASLLEIIVHMLSGLEVVTGP